jgi:predicted membrane-bound spermidine synthase
VSDQDDDAGRALRLPVVRRLRAAALILWGAAAAVMLAWPLFSAFASGAPRSGFLFGIIGVVVAVACWHRSDVLQKRAIAAWVAAAERGPDASPHPLDAP